MRFSYDGNFQLGYNNDKAASDIADIGVDIRIAQALAEVTGARTEEVI